MRKLLWIIVCALPLSAQNPFTDDAKATWSMVKATIIKAADRMPEDKYSFKPADGVRTFGELVLHQAQGQGAMCGAASGQKMAPPAKKPETKAELMAVLNAAGEFCDAAFASMNDAAGAEKVQLFGMSKPKLSWLYFNNTHSYEHYGNMATYLRINGLVPPSSDPRK